MGKRDPTNFSLYIYKVLKQVHPQLSLSAKGMALLNDYVLDILNRIVQEARNIGILTGLCVVLFCLFTQDRETLTSRDIQTAARLVLPGEIAKHAVSEGVKAVVKFNASGGGPGKASMKAGLTFPVPRVKNLLRLRWKGRVGRTAAVYLAAVLEYMVAELLELGGNAARDFRLSRITPRHLNLAIRGDEELDTFCRSVVLAGGGVIPHIHKYLIDHP